MERVSLVIRFAKHLFPTCVALLLFHPLIVQGADCANNCGNNCTQRANYNGGCQSDDYFPYSCLDNILGVDRSCAGCGGFQADLFRNYYVAPRCDAQYTAVMYQAPQPTPPIAGRVYYTYQPFLPHQLMYQHNRVYHRYYNCNQGLNRTHASYNPSAWYATKNIVHWLTEIPR